MLGLKLNHVSKKGPMPRCANRVRFRDTILRYGNWSILVWAITCCLMTQIHHSSQCYFIESEPYIVRKASLDEILCECSWLLSVFKNHILELKVSFSRKLSRKRYLLLEQSRCMHPFARVTHCPGPRLNIKTVLSMYGDFHVKDKTAVRTSYL